MVPPENREGKTRYSSRGFSEWITGSPKHRSSAARQATARAAASPWWIDSIAPARADRRRHERMLRALSATQRNGVKAAVAPPKPSARKSSRTSRGQGQAQGDGGIAALLCRGSAYSRHGGYMRSRPGLLRRSLQLPPTDDDECVVPAASNCQRPCRSRRQQPPPQHPTPDQKLRSRSDVIKPAQCAFADSERPQDACRQEPHPRVLGWHGSLAAQGHVFVARTHPT